MTSVARVRLWGRTIGAVALADDERTAAFEYAPAFIGSGIEVAPLTMPLASRVYRFPELAYETFHGDVSGKNGFPAIDDRPGR